VGKFQMLSIVYVSLKKKSYTNIKLLRPIFKDKKEVKSLKTVKVQIMLYNIQQYYNWLISHVWVKILYLKHNTSLIVDWICVNINVNKNNFFNIS